MIEADAQAAEALAADLRAREQTARVNHGMLLGISAAVVLLAAVLQVSPDGRGILVPFSGGRVLPSTCGMQRLFHVRCPTCGLTRSFVHVAHLRLGQAWHYHRMGIPLFLGILFQIPYRVCLLRTRREPPARLRRALMVVLWVLLALLLVNWLAELPVDVALRAGGATYLPE
jgi:hypothetical protein